MNAHELTARFVSEVRWDALPGPVQHKARMCFVDNLGGTLAGTLTRVSQIGASYPAAVWPGDEASIFRQVDGRGLQIQPASAVGAAFANGCASNGIDIDDSARYAYGHAGAQVFPTALAVSESEGLSGADMLCGMVVGYEVAHRVGRCWHHSRTVYQACGSWGSVACAAIAAHLMRLDPQRTAHALGIAEYYAPNLPMMRDVEHPAMVKHGVPWAAMTGVISAGLAAEGFTGIPGILSFPEYQEWGQDIGREYLMVDGVAWKSSRYACCGWAHAGVEGARRLVEENSIALDDIAEFLVEGCHGTLALGTRLPTTTEESQFNQAWPLAAMLIDGEIGPPQMLEGRLQDPAIRELAAKVRVVESPELEGLCRLFEQGDPAGRFASKVTITLRDGRSYHSGLVDGGLRFPQPGWDHERMSDKFRWVAGFVLDRARIDRLLDLLWRFEEVPDVHRFMRELL
jgi:2-methylcitrate dehydratase PrpD